MAIRIEKAPVLDVFDHAELAEQLDHIVVGGVLVREIRDVHDCRGRVDGHRLVALEPEAVLLAHVYLILLLVLEVLHLKGDLAVVGEEDLGKFILKGVRKIDGLL